MKSLLILGRQPALGLAELESLYGPKVLKPLHPNAVLVDLAASEIDFNRLGGSIKLTTVLDTLITTNWREIAQVLERLVPKLIKDVPEGKFRLGLSVYGIRVSPRDLQATSLGLKKIIKNSGRSVRVIPNNSPSLSSAQIIHNKLTNETGWELVMFRDGARTILALTKAEQDIEAYSARDQNRPKRDAKVGMLPPKLAQIVINLANPAPNTTVLDPFCGTGVLLQEALLMGFKAYGTDIDNRMVEYSRENLDWLLRGRPATWEVETGDAIKHTWDPFDAVAGETFLGKPLSREPEEKLLRGIMAECDQIHRGFLSNISRQAKKGTMFCLAVPSWRVKGGFKHLKTLDYLRELGYTRIEFVHAKRSDLLYFREDQYVARELVVLKKD